ncbi:pectinesterase inhibitor 2-like protein [Trifolium pratense]|uniref:Pectinesterase inhibitor 2-like protein n=1 Tax=Trifolium pratense TaxID=57577 RepID=A0A2K3KZA0_TRIPR|nr:pectinesterase inhibitor 2-like protein [Trifolium pratense]
MKVVDVDTICKNVADNPSFCLTLLKPKQGADLVTLGQYTIDVARIKLTNTINLIKKLISQSGSDPKAKDHYEYCLSRFGAEGGAFSRILDSEKCLKNGDYFGFGGEVDRIIADYSSCITGDSPSDPPYPDKSLLPKYAGIFLDVVEIMLAISFFLPT